MSQRTVLFVDDEPAVLRSLQRLFRRTSISALTASNGDEALQLLEEHDVHVIVSDQRMKGMSGTQFLKYVRESRPDTVRCILSGYAEMYSILEAINEGHVYRFIAKPWDDEDIVQTIRECIAEYEIAAQKTLLSLSKDVLEALPVAIAAVDSSGSIVFTNRMFDDRYNDVPGSLPGQPAGEPWAQAVQAAAEQDQTIANIEIDVKGATHSATLRNAEIGGNTFSLITIANPIAAQGAQK